MGLVAKLALLSACGWGSCAARTGLWRMSVSQRQLRPWRALLGPRWVHWATPETLTGISDWSLWVESVAGAFDRSEGPCPMHCTPSGGL